MRFLHTADWHLGRLFHQKHLTEDQAVVLRQLIEIARDQQVDAIVVAGDVYDRGVPPPDAVRLLDDVLAELLLGLKVPVIVAAGNHDSPERLAFGSRLLAREGLHLFGLPSASLAPVVLSDAHGEVAFYVVPYAEPALIRQALSGHGTADAVAQASVLAHDTVAQASVLASSDHDAAMRALLSSMLAAHPIRVRSVFVGHAFVQGALASESERPLSVGGAGSISASCFDGFHYVALGHLHRPQGVAGQPSPPPPRHGGPAVTDAKAGPPAEMRYAGAILQYSFDEVGQSRSVTIVDIDAAGAVRTAEVPLAPRRALRRVEGTLEELLSGAGVSPARGLCSDDYIVARLLDRHPVLDPIGRLRALYPNVLCIERPAVALGPEGRPQGDRRQLGHGELFEQFFREVTGAPPTPEERAVFDAVAAQLDGAEREVLA